MFRLALLVLLVAGPLALVGVLVVTDGWRDALIECRPCEGPVFSRKTVLLASVFIAIAPLVKRSSVL